MNALSVTLSGMMFKTGPWNLTDLKDIKPNGYKVFSCFHCGGGSTMGYKLSGFEVLGGVEIDPKMMAVYQANHKPKHPYLMGVGDFNRIQARDLPKELFDLDILDGSPPCSSFSMAGSREKKWGKKKKFREGQAEQVLDDLFFQFIETARKLQPKIIVAENVKGLILGKAKGYVKQIAQMLKLAGYDVQLFLLNAAFMGVPQRRERTFFIAKRNDLKLGSIKLRFDEQTISINKIDCKDRVDAIFYEKRYGDVAQDMNKPASTLASAQRLFDKDKKLIGDKTLIRIQSFPEDYNFLKNKTAYICGMSVPPYMMNRISKQIQIQWLDKLKESDL